MQRTTLFAFLILVVFTTTACTGGPADGAPYDLTGSHDADATGSDVPVVDAGDVAPEIDDGRDGVADAGGDRDVRLPEPDGDAGGGGDSSDDVQQTDCECVDPEATCIYHQEYCGLPERGCLEDNDCPDGYHCSSQFDAPSRCVCSGTSQDCGPFCDDHTDCPGSEVCETSERFDTEGFCRSAYDLNCSSDFACGPGRHCVETSRGSICQSTGSSPQGASCAGDGDCQSGNCQDGQCTDVCLSDADCPAGEHCTTAHESAGGDGCNAVACSVSCPDNWRCVEGECRRPFCLTTGDCPEGDCLYLGGPGAGKCLVDEESRCKPGEVRMDEDDPYCRLPDPCSCLEHQGEQEECEVCPESYTCSLIPGHQYHDLTSVCSRRVVEEGS